MFLISFCLVAAFDSCFGAANIAGLAIFCKCFAADGTFQTFPGFQETESKLISFCLVAAFDSCFGAANIAGLAIFCKCFAADGTFQTFPGFQETESKVQVPFGHLCEL